MSKRTTAEIREAISTADLAAEHSRTQTRRLMAQAVADALRWSLGEDKSTNVARSILGAPR